MEKQSELKYKEFWNERYQDSNYAYGKEPNMFFKEQLQKLKPGAILLPADGEGRNGVFAAKLGWEVTAVDLSKEGHRKALQLASEQHVNIDYVVEDIQNVELLNKPFDAIALIYAHFSSWKISPIHQKLTQLLKENGMIIFEAYSKKHLAYKEVNPKVGGPGDIDMLFSLEQIRADFKDLEIQVLEEKEIILNEGEFHKGTGSVIRFVGKRISQ
ncbi:class I SAM-dependent methyltransferase [Flavivirga eckloniae]|uniref:SAM-dependent methyltransferase n=1 Tax=Flavivirga eckloniae TaxID=1803846 RepID=A0A2K9PMM7_9FLAO|nr:class I SAM-dependent methyltransferase [Flavivirga eckloniae]AUP78324.1 SAM-dependent methyltransferase [Flavivirga eckloniae]